MTTTPPLADVIKELRELLEQRSKVPLYCEDWARLGYCVHDILSEHLPQLLTAAEKAERYERALGLARHIVEGTRRSLYVGQNENGLIPYAQIDMLLKQSMLEYDLLISQAIAPQQEGVKG